MKVNLKVDKRTVSRVCLSKMILQDLTLLAASLFIRELMFFSNP